MEKNRIDILLQFLEEDPNDSFVRFALGKEYEKMGAKSKALEVMITLRDQDPEYVGLYYHLAALQIELDQVAEAMKTYEKGIEIAKKQADFHALSELHTAKQNIEIQ